MKWINFVLILILFGLRWMPEKQQEVVYQNTIKYEDKQYILFDIRGMFGDEEFPIYTPLYVEETEFEEFLNGQRLSAVYYWEAVEQIESINRQIKEIEKKKAVVDEALENTRADENGEENDGS